MDAYKLYRELRCVYGETRAIGLTHRLCEPAPPPPPPPCATCKGRRVVPVVDPEWLDPPEPLFTYCPDC